MVCCVMHIVLDEFPTPCNTRECFGMYSPQISEISQANSEISDKHWKELEESSETTLSQAFSTLVSHEDVLGLSRVPPKMAWGSGGGGR